MTILGSVDITAYSEIVDIVQCACSVHRSFACPRNINLDGVFVNLDSRRNLD